MSSVYTAHLAHGGPPILPMYKNNIRKKAPQLTFLTTMFIFFFLCGFLGCFFCSIYYGASYLHEHLQDEKWGNTIGLPGTRNIIQKWSVKHLGGIDLTALGPPAKKKIPDTVNGVDTTKISAPFQFMFHSPFEKKEVVDKVVIEGIESDTVKDEKDEKDGGNMIPALANSFEKLVAESVVKVEEKVSNLAADFKKMLADASAAGKHTGATEHTDARVVLTDTAVTESLPVEAMIDIIPDLSIESAPSLDSGAPQ